MASCEGHARAGLIVAAARALVGVRFRRQGRGPDGLDCVGLVVAAARGAGIGVSVPDWLPYRGLGAAEVEALFRTGGCAEIGVAAARAGDVMLRWAAVRQPHLAVRTERGIVEAHGGVGRTVERHLDATEEWQAAWRLPEGDM